jgi:glutathione S-transferase
MLAIWKECLATYGGPYLFGKTPAAMADAMYAPVVTRFLTYDVAMDKVCRRLLQDASWTCRPCRSGSPLRRLEPDEIDELDAEF